MRERTRILMLGLAACGGAKGTTAPAPASASPVAASAPASAPAGAAPGCEGWQIQDDESDHMRDLVITVACTAGQPTLEWVFSPDKGDPPPVEDVKLTQATWNHIWQVVEDARWRTLDPACSQAAAAPPSGPSYRISDATHTVVAYGATATALQLTITDGKTKVQVHCEDPTHFLPAHVAILRALDDAADAGLP